MNNGMSIETAIVELQKPLSGPHAGTWAFGPAVRTLIAALEQAQTEREEFRRRLKLEREILEDTEKKLERAQQESKVQLETLANVTELWNEQRQHIAELEARQLSVKLPSVFWYEHDDLSRDVPVMNAREVKKAIRDAGGKVEGE